jgi:hypothetical protein
MPARLPWRLSKLSETDWPSNPDSAVNVMTYAERGVSLEQRTHRTVMFQSYLLLGTPFATVEDSAHRTAAHNFAQRHRPIAFAAEGLRLALCFAFNCGIRV